MPEEADAVFRIEPIIDPSGIDAFVATALQAIDQVAAAADAASRQSSAGGLSAAPAPAVAIGAGNGALGGVATAQLGAINQQIASLVAAASTAIDPGSLQRALETVGQRFNTAVEAIETLQLPGFRPPDFTAITAVGEQLVQGLTQQVRAVAAAAPAAAQAAAPALAAAVAPVAAVVAAETVQVPVTRRHAELIRGLEEPLSGLPISGGTLSVPVGSFAPLLGRVSAAAETSLAARNLQARLEAAAPPPSLEAEVAGLRAAQAEAAGAGALGPASIDFKVLNQRELYRARQQAQDEGADESTLRRAANAHRTALGINWDEYNARYGAQRLPVFVPGQGSGGFGNTGANFRRSGGPPPGSEIVPYGPNYRREGEPDERDFPPQVSREDLLNTYAQKIRNSYAGYVEEQLQARGFPTSQRVAASAGIEVDEETARGANSEMVARLKRVEVLAESIEYLKAQNVVDKESTELGDQELKLRAERVVIQQQQAEKFKAAVSQAYQDAGVQEPGVRQHGFGAGFRRGLSGFRGFGGGGDETSGLGGALEGFGTQVGFGLTIGAGIKVFSDVQQAVKDAIALNQQINVLRGQFNLLGPGAGSFDSLRSSILGTSAATGVAGSELATLASEFLGLYQNAGQAAAAVEQAGKTILITGASASTVGPQLGAIIDNLGGAGGVSVQNINDAIATAQVRTGRTAADALGAFAQLAPEFGAGGGDLSQLTALFNVVGKGSAFSGQQIGEQLSRVLPQFQQHIVPLEYYGFNFSAAAKGGNLPAQITDLLQGAQTIRATRSPQDAQSTLTSAARELGGPRGTRFFQELLNNRNALQAFQSGDIIQGAGSELAAQKLDSLSGQLSKLKTTFAALVQELYDSGLGKVFTDLASGADAFLRVAEAIVSVLAKLGSGFHGLVGEVAVAGAAIALLSRSGGGAAASAAGGGGSGLLQGALLGRLTGRGGGGITIPPAEDAAAATGGFSLTGGTALGAAFLPAAAFTLIAASQVQKAYDNQRASVKQAQQQLAQEAANAPTSKLLAESASFGGGGFTGFVTRNVSDFVTRNVFGTPDRAATIRQPLLQRAAAGTAGDAALDVTAQLEIGGLDPAKLGSLTPVATPRHQYQDLIDKTAKDYDAILKQARDKKTLNDKALVDLRDQAVKGGTDSEAYKDLVKIQAAFPKTDILGAADKIKRDRDQAAANNGQWTADQINSATKLQDAQKQYQAGQITFSQYLDALNFDIAANSNTAPGTQQSDKALQESADRFAALNQVVIDSLNNRLKVYQTIGGALGQKLSIEDINKTLSSVEAYNFSPQQRQQLAEQEYTQTAQGYTQNLQASAQFGATPPAPPTVPASVLRAYIEAQLAQGIGVRPDGSIDPNVFPEPYRTYLVQNLAQFTAYLQGRGAGGFSARTAYGAGHPDAFAGNFTTAGVGLAVDPLAFQIASLQGQQVQQQAGSALAVAQAGATFDQQAVARANLQAAQAAAVLSPQLAVAQYKQSLAPGTDPTQAYLGALQVQTVATEQAQAGVVTAQTGVESANQAAAAAQASYAAQIAKYDPVAVAKAQIKGVELQAVAIGKNITQVLEAARDGHASAQEYQLAQQYISANQDLVQATNDIANAQITYAKSLATAARDPVKAAQLNVALLRQQLVQARQQGRGPAEILGLQGQIAEAIADVSSTQLQLLESHVQALLATKQLSAGQAITQLQAAKRLAHGQQEIDQLNQLIYQIQHAAGSDIQYNLPQNIQLPTLYEARRVNATPGGSIGYQDNRTVSVTVQVANASDVPAVQTAIAKAAGMTDLVYGTAARKY